MLTLRSSVSQAEGIDDQSLRMTNQGHTMMRIGWMIQLQPALARNWLRDAAAAHVDIKTSSIYALMRANDSDA